MPECADVAELRAWLSALRQAEVDAQISHLEAFAHTERHLAALERERNELITRIREIERTPAWRTHMALARMKRRLARVVGGQRG